MAQQIGGSGHALASLGLELRDPQHLAVAAGNVDTRLPRRQDGTGPGGSIRSPEMSCVVAQGQGMRPRTWQETGWAERLQSMGDISRESMEA